MKDQLTMATPLMTAAVQPMPLSMYFRLHPDSQNYGVLRQNENGRLEFEGDADEAALCFFQHVVRLHDTRTRMLEKKLEAAKRALQAVAEAPGATDSADQARKCLEEI